MADVLMKNIRKKTLRTKESLRETFGKVDKTTDETFEENCNEFGKQQKSAERLQRELKNYILCLKAVNQAGKGLYEAVCEVYEPHWQGVEHVKAITDSLDLLWNDYLETLNDDALLPLNYYCSQFLDIRTKIAKRGRKLVDYDATRHTFNSVQSSTKKDEVKLHKAKEQMNIAKKLYDDLNNELLVALPELYDSRVDFTVNHLKVLFKAEEAFHRDTSKLDGELYDELSKMKIDESKTLTFGEKEKEKEKALALLVPHPNGHKSPENGSPSPKLTEKRDRESKGSTEAIPENASPKSHSPMMNREENGPENVKLYPSLSKLPPNTNSTPPNENDTNPFNDTDRRDDHGSGSKTVNADPVPSLRSENASHHHGEKASPRADRPNEKDAVGPTSQQPQEPTTVLYKVRATHRYSAEDADELTFDSGDIISVVASNDPDEQDEGWLTGIKEATGDKGVFPENFTKPL